MTAGVAVNAEESMGQDAAFEVGADLALDEAGDGGALGSRSGEEGDELRADDFVEEGLLGLVASVFGDGRPSAGTESQTSKRVFVKLSRHATSGDSCTGFHASTRAAGHVPEPVVAARVIAADGAGRRPRA